MIYVLLCDYSKPHSGFYGLVAGAFNDLNVALYQCRKMNELSERVTPEEKRMYYWLVAMRTNTALGNVVKSSLSITTHIKHN